MESERTQRGQQNHGSKGLFQGLTTQTRNKTLKETTQRTVNHSSNERQMLGQNLVRRTGQSQVQTIYHL